MSFLLVPVLLTVGFTSAYRLFAHGRDLELTFVQLDNNSYFDSTRMGWYTINGLGKLLAYEDEQAIRDGRYINVVRRDTGEEYREYERVEYTDPETGETVYEEPEDTYTWVEYQIFDTIDENTTYVGEDEVEWNRRGVINDQLYDWRELNNDLAAWAEDGMLYYATNGTRTITNVENATEELFTALPVYRVVRDGFAEQSSRDVYRNYQAVYMAGTEIYVGYPQSTVDAFNARMRQEQIFLQQGIALPACAFLGACIALVILLLGAGRRFGDRRTVYLTALDRPWLDLGFCVAGAGMLLLAAVGSHIGYLVFVRYFEYGGSEFPPLWQVVALLGVLCTTGSVLTLWWLGSLFKRLKDGSWWRHTLCHRLVRWAVGLGRSMWAGVHLTQKAIAVSVAAFIAALLCSIFPFLLIFFAAGVMVLLMRFARRLMLLQQGAELAVQGQPYPPMLQLGGTLGGIAQTVGNVSAGIGEAVEARLKSERMKTELITNVSHDIRTPLTSLITYTDLLRNEGLDSEHAEEYLDVLVQKAQRLKGLTDELFEAAKAATGNVETHPEPLDLAALVRQSLGEHDERVQESGLSFVLNLPEHATVIADGRLLSRVMENLLSNVFKYALPGSRVYIDLSSEGGELCMEVKNISAAQLGMDPAELTERFTRGDSARSGDGSGLGLAIVQSFVEAMNGRFVLTIDGDLFKAAVYLPPAAV